ncbi:MAG: hypothetical protein F4X36_09865 [Gammaproteobacteria bacterium]|nr:hypothetical protein [Gammaproteobacteria bacterium]
MTIELPDDIRTAVSARDGTTVFIIDARDDDSLKQAVAVSRLNATLLRQLGKPPSATIGSSPAIARQGLAAVRRRRPRGILVRALCPLAGQFRYWVAYANVRLTDAEADYVCWQCEGRSAPDFPDEPAIVDFGGLDLTRAELRRAGRKSTH